MKTSFGSTLNYFTAEAPKDKQQQRLGGYKYYDFDIFEIDCLQRGLLLRKSKLKPNIVYAINNHMKKVGYFNIKQNFGEVKRILNTVK